MTCQIAKKRAAGNTIVYGKLLNMGHAFFEAH